MSVLYAIRPCGRVTAVRWGGNDQERKQFIDKCTSRGDDMREADSMEGLKFICDVCRNGFCEVKHV